MGTQPDKMARLIIIILFLSVLPGHLTALNVSGEDTAFVNRQMLQARRLHYIAPDSAIFYYQQIIKYIPIQLEQLDQNLSPVEKAYLSAVIRAQDYTGDIFYYDDEYNRAESFYTSSLEIARKAGFKEFIANSLYNVGYIRYVTNTFTQAADMFMESYGLFSETGNNQGMFDAIQACALAQRHLGNMNQADSSYRRAFELARLIGDSLQVADVQLNYGILLCEEGNLDEGTRNFEKALNYYESHGEKEAVSLALLNIGVVFKMMGDYPKALSYLKRSTEMEEVSGLKSQLVIRYYNLADLYLEMKQLGPAYDYCRKTLEVASEIGSRPFVTECNLLLGKYYYFKDEFKNAEKYLKAAHDSVKSSNDKPLMTSILLWNSRNSLARGKIADAILMAHESVRLSDDSQLMMNRKEAALILSQAYEKKGDLALAIGWFKQFQLYSDSLNYNNQLKEIMRIESKYNYEKKEKENELLRNNASLQAQKLKNRNLLTFALLAGFVLSFLMIMLLVRRYKDARLLLHQQQVINLKHLEELELELDGKNRELTSKMMFLNQKSDLITRLIQRLQEIRDNDENSSEEIVSLVNELRSDAPQSSWKEFEAQFVQVHPGFYQRLFEKHPDLTSYEQRISAFLRMNLNTKEISAITGRSPKSIEVARSRIRTKLKLKRNENLSSYLAAV